MFGEGSLLVCDDSRRSKKKEINRVFFCFVFFVAVGGHFPWTSREVVEGGGRVEPSAVCLSAWPV